MSEKSACRTRNKLAKIYGAGIIAFISIFGFVTLFAIFVAHLK